MSDDIYYEPSVRGSDNDSRILEWLEIEDYCENLKKQDDETIVNYEKAYELEYKKEEMLNKNCKENSINHEYINRFSQYQSDFENKYYSTLDEKEMNCEFNLKQFNCQKYTQTSPFSQSGQDRTYSKSICSQNHYFKDNLNFLNEAEDKQEISMGLWDDVYDYLVEKNQDKANHKAESYIIDYSGSIKDSNLQHSYNSCKQKKISKSELRKNLLDKSINVCSNIKSYNQANLKYNYYKHKSQSYKQNHFNLEKRLPIRLRVGSSNSPSHLYNSTYLFSNKLISNNFQLIHSTHWRKLKKRKVIEFQLHEKKYEPVNEKKYNSIWLKPSSFDISEETFTTLESIYE